MKDYSGLDEMILAKIEGKPKTFAEIYFPEICHKCAEFCSGQQDPARVLDRRLQALKNKGLIQFSKGWVKVGSGVA